MVVLSKPGTQMLSGDSAARIGLLRSYGSHGMKVHVGPKEKCKTIFTTLYDVVIRFFGRS